MTTSDENTRKLENQAQHLDYYPHWLDNLADDVILQGAVFNGELRGAEQVGKMLSFARSLYAFQDFRFYGQHGDLFLEDYRSRIRGSEAYHPAGVEIYNFVVVYFNDAGETSQLRHEPPAAVGRPAVLVVVDRALRRCFRPEPVLQRRCQRSFA